MSTMKWVEIWIMATLDKKIPLYVKSPVDPHTGQWHAITVEKAELGFPPSKKINTGFLHT